MGELHLKECLIYLDDIIIFSKSFDEHIKSLENVFSLNFMVLNSRLLNASFLRQVCSI